jgi:hypothetical protein
VNVTATASTTHAPIATATEFSVRLIGLSYEYEENVSCAEPKVRCDCFGRSASKPPRSRIPVNNFRFGTLDCVLTG